MKKERFRDGGKVDKEEKAKDNAPDKAEEAAPASDDTEEEDPAEPATSPAAPSVGTSADAAQVPATNSGAAPSQAAQGVQPAPAQNQAPAQPASPEVAPQATAAPQAPQTPMTPEQEAQGMLQNQLKFGQDVANGHITPKTYHDLYAKNPDGSDRGTLGKIGMIFGLLASGAGSGLTHQPNALLEMMNKEIERDYDAQKNEQANKQNWYKASLDHNRMLSENSLRNVQTDLATQQVAYQHYLNRKTGVTDADGLNNMSAAAISDIQTNVINKMPPGPQRDAAQQQLDSHVSPFFINKGYQRNLEATQKKSAVSAIDPQNPANQAAKSGKQKDSGQPEDVVDQKKYTAMLNNGALKSSSGRPYDFNTDIDPADRTNIDTAVSKARVNAHNYKDTADAVKQIMQMPNAGEVPLGRVGQALKGIPWIGDALAQASHFGQGQQQRPRDQLLDALGQRLMKNGESESSVEGLKTALAPSMFDTPETRAKIPELLHQHFAHNDAANPEILSRYGLSKPMKKIDIEMPNHAFQPGDDNPTFKNGFNPTSSSGS